MLEEKCFSAKNKKVTQTFLLKNTSNQTKIKEISYDINILKSTLLNIKTEF